MVGGASRAGACRAFARRTQGGSPASLWLPTRQRGSQLLPAQPFLFQTHLNISRTTAVAGEGDEQQTEADDEAFASNGGRNHGSRGRLAANQEDTTAAAMAGMPRYTETSFEGISVQPFPPRVARKLLEPLDPSLVEIKPDGTIFLPEINFRRILNSAFGPGGWALMPRGQATQSDKFYIREWALFCHGRFISQACGESEILIAHMGPATALEGSKSQALVRCCKDIGIASDLWDSAYVSEWKSKHALAVMCENMKTGQKKLLYRRRDRPPFGYPWKETTTMSAASTPTSVAAASPAPDATMAAARKAPVAAAEPFDMESTLPRELKRHAGKRWSEVLGTEEGRNYVEFIANNFAGPAKTLCRRALETYQTSLSKK